MTIRIRALSISTIAAAMAISLAPAAVQAEGHDSPIVTIYFTRHAEKKTTTTVVKENTTNYSLSYDDAGNATAQREPGRSDGDRLDQVCTGMDDDCAEELNAFGLVRADLLVDFFERRGIVDELDAVYSSHKFRTYQTVLPTAAAAGLDVVQLPTGETELSTGTSASECPTIEAIRNAPQGSTLLVAGHSGTLYDIMGDGNDDCDGLGLDTSNDNRFPKDEDGKVRDFGDLWKVVIRNGQARFVYRVNLQPKYLFIENKAF